MLELPPGRVISNQHSSADVIHSLQRVAHSQESGHEAKEISRAIRHECVNARYARCILKVTLMSDEPATPALSLRGRWTSAGEFETTPIPVSISWGRVIL